MSKDISKIKSHIHTKVGVSLARTDEQAGVARYCSILDTNTMINNCKLLYMNILFDIKSLMLNQACALISFILRLHHGIAFDVKRKDAKESNDSILENAKELQQSCAYSFLSYLTRMMGHEKMERVELLVTWSSQPTLVHFLFFSLCSSTFVEHLRCFICLFWLYCVFAFLSIAFQNQHNCNPIYSLFTTISTLSSSTITTTITITTTTKTTTCCRNELSQQPQQLQQLQ